MSGGKHVMWRNSEVGGRLSSIAGHCHLAPPARVCACFVQSTGHREVFAPRKREVTRFSRHCHEITTSLRQTPGKGLREKATHLYPDGKRQTSITFGLPEHTLAYSRNGDTVAFTRTTWQCLTGSHPPNTQNQSDFRTTSPCRPTFGVASRQVSQAELHGERGSLQELDSADQSSDKHRIILAT